MERQPFDRLPFAFVLIRFCANARMLARLVRGHRQWFRLSCLHLVYFLSLPCLFLAYFSSDSCTK